MQRESKERTKREQREKAILFSICSLTPRLTLYNVTIHKGGGPAASCVVTLYGPIGSICGPTRTRKVLAGQSPAKSKHHSFPSESLYNINRAQWEGAGTTNEFLRFQGVVHCLIAGMHAAWTALPNPSTNPFPSDSDGNEWCLDLAGDCPARTFRVRVGS